MSKEKSTADYATERIGYLQSRADRTYREHKEKRQQIAQKLALSLGAIVVGAGCVMRDYPNAGLVAGGAGLLLLGNALREHTQELTPLTAELRSTVDQAVHLARVNDINVPFRIGDYIVNIGNSPKTDEA